MTPAHRKRLAELLAIFAGTNEVGGMRAFTTAEQRRLAWAVKHHLVRTERRPWPGPLVGTCVKTYYVRIGF